MSWDTQVLHTEEYGPYTISLYPDHDCDDPMHDFNDNAILVSMHRRYGKSARDHGFDDSEEFDDKLRANLESDNYGFMWDGGYVIPVWMYEHGSSTYSTSPFSSYASWDSGVYGFLYFQPSYLEELGYKRVSPQRRKTLYGYADSMLGEYQSWANGEGVYFVLTDADGESVDSCGGYYSWEYALERAKEENPLAPEQAA